MVRKTISGKPGRRGTVRGRRGGNDGGGDACPVSEVPYSDSSTPLDAIQERVVIASEVPSLNPSNADGRGCSRITHSASEVLHSNSSTPHDVQESFVVASEVPHLSSSSIRSRGFSKAVHPTFEVLHPDSSMTLDATQGRVVTTCEMSNSYLSRGRGRGCSRVTVAATVQQSNSSTPLDAIQERIGITSEVPETTPSSSRGRGRIWITRPASEMPHLSSSGCHGRDHSRLTHPASEVPHLDSSTSLDAIIDRVVATSGVPHLGPSIPFNAKRERDINASFPVLHSSSCMSPDVNQERMIDATAVQQMGSFTPLDEIKERDVDATSSDTNTSITESGLQSKIHPDGDGFAPNPTGVAHYIGRIIQTNFNGPWPTWKKVPTDVRDMWFGEFKKRFGWLPEHERQIRISFENKGRIRLKENFCDARKKPNIRPFWLSPEVWDSLLVYWGSDEFKAKSAQAKINRASGDGSGSHTGGSIPASEHKRRLEAKLGREITTAELFMHLHQKKDKSWVDNKSSQAYEKFSRKWKEIQAGQNSSGHESEGPSTYTSISELDVWINENGKRGRIYGLGSEGAKFKATSHRVQTITSFADSSELRDMLSKMQEQLNKERQEKEELGKRIAILEQDKLEKDEAISRMQRQNNEVIAFMMKQHRKAEKHMNKKFHAMMCMFRTSRGDGGDDTTSDSE